jgi:hypothetical protein
MSALPPKADIGTGTCITFGSNSGSLAMFAAIRLASSRGSKFRRHFFGFSFADNNTATSCCHGSVLYSGPIFREI